MSKIQHWNYRLRYGLIILPIMLITSIKRGITPFSLIHINNFANWGLPFAPKHAFLKPFEQSPQFLPHLQLTTQTTEKNISQFMKLHKLSYPLIAKPECRVVGVGIQKINNEKELQSLIKKLPTTYLLQPFVTHQHEFGVHYFRYPWEKEGRVIGLTKKIIPTVTGDGKQNIRQLIKQQIKGRNKQALLAHANNLDTVLNNNKTIPVITQASHTYGAVFQDWECKITLALNNWMNTLCTQTNDFFIGRFDMKVEHIADLQTGKNVKIIELNGVTAEPIQLYDEKYSFLRTIRQIYKFYNNVFRVAKYNKQGKKTPIKIIIRKYRLYIKELHRIKKIIG